MRNADSRCPLCCKPVSEEPKHFLYYLEGGSTEHSGKRVRFLREAVAYDGPMESWGAVNTMKCNSDERPLFEGTRIVGGIKGNTACRQRICPECGAFLPRGFGRRKMQRYSVVAADSFLARSFVFGMRGQMDIICPEKWSSKAEFVSKMPLPRAQRGHVLFEKNLRSKSFMALEVSAAEYSESWDFLRYNLMFTEGIIIPVKTGHSCWQKDLFNILDLVWQLRREWKGPKVKIPVAVLLINDNHQSEALPYMSVAKRTRTLMNGLEEENEALVRMMRGKFRKLQLFECDGYYSSPGAANAVRWLLGWARR